MTEHRVRCVNVDWLEIYALEDLQAYPMNAEYFRRCGYFVTEREYGTRVYKEMFTIQDPHGDAWIEVRRNPMSGDSSFSGLQINSCHLRMVNRYCYQDNPVRDMAEFMIKHNYMFRSIYRIDVCYDFLTFDSGDRPDAFLRRYIEKKFSKINQTKVRAMGSDGWASFDWESVSWGAPKSMVGTKIYNKTKELSATGNKKPWIVQAWLKCGLIDDPRKLPNVWRLEFSLSSSIRDWIMIEAIQGKKIKKKRVPHTMNMFDGRDKLWRRFEELAYHYFHFRYVQYKQSVNSDQEPELLRKDLCKDKQLFKFNTDREFYQIGTPSRESSPTPIENRLKAMLQNYIETHYNLDVNRAAMKVMEAIDIKEIQRYTKSGSYPEIEAIIMQIRSTTGWEYDVAKEVAEQVQELYKQQEIW